MGTDGFDDLVVLLIVRHGCGIGWERSETRAGYR